MKNCIVILIVILSGIASNAQSLRKDVWTTNVPPTKISVIDSFAIVSGSFDYIGLNTGSMLQFDALSMESNPNIPFFDDEILDVVEDGNGGWFVVGMFEYVDNIHTGGLVHLLPDGSLDKKLITNIDVYGGDEKTRLYIIDDNLWMLNGSVYKINIKTGHIDYFYVHYGQITNRQNKKFEKIGKYFLLDVFGTYYFKASTFYQQVTYIFDIENEKLTLIKDETDHYTINVVGDNIFYENKYNENKFFKVFDFDTKTFIDYSDQSMEYYLSGKLFSSNSQYQYFRASSPSDKFALVKLKLDDYSLDTLEFEIKPSLVIDDYYGTICHRIYDDEYFYYSIKDGTDYSVIRRCFQSTGKLDSTWSIITSSKPTLICPHRDKLFLGGTMLFTNGMKIKSLAKININTGLPDSTWFVPELQTMYKEDIYDFQIIDSSIFFVSNPIYYDEINTDIGKYLKHPAKVNLNTARLDTNWSPPDVVITNYKKPYSYLTCDHDYIYLTNYRIKSANDISLKKLNISTGSVVASSSTNDSISGRLFQTTNSIFTLGNLKKNNLYFLTRIDKLTCDVDKVLSTVQYFSINEKKVNTIIINRGLLYLTNYKLNYKANIGIIDPVNFSLIKSINTSFSSDIPGICLDSNRNLIYVDNWYDYLYITDISNNNYSSKMYLSPIRQIYDMQIYKKNLIISGITATDYPGRASDEGTAVLGFHIFDLSKPKSPFLIFPYKFHNNLPLTVVLEWRPIPYSTKYKVQVSESMDFEDIKIEKTITDTTAQITGLEEGVRYYWRVKSYRGDIESDWSVVWNFFTTPPVSVQEEDKSVPELYIYPNPTFKDLHLIFSDQSDTRNIEIVSVIGKSIGKYHFNQNNSTLDISSYPSGIYYIIYKGKTYSFIKE